MSKKSGVQFQGCKPKNSEELKRSKLKKKLLADLDIAETWEESKPIIRKMIEEME